MSDAGIALRQVVVEQKSFWRNPASAFFAFLFPIIFLVVFATIFKDSRATFGSTTIAYDDYYIPALVAFGVMGACYTNIAVSLSLRRDTGILKRMRGTPMPPWAFVAGLVGSSILISVILAALTTGFGMLVYQVHAPQHIAALVLVLALGGLVFCALGVAMTILIPNAEASPAIVNAAFFPLVFISGTFFPIDQTSVLARIANWFPVRHFIDAAFTAFDPVHQSAGGINGNDLLIMLAWGAAAVLIATRRFRWEPRRV